MLSTNSCWSGLCAEACLSLFPDAFKAHCEAAFVEDRLIKPTCVMRALTPGSQKRSFFRGEKEEKKKMKKCLGGLVADGSLALD